MTPVNYEILQCRSSGLLLLGDQLEAERLQLTGNNSGQGTNPDCLQPRESFCKHLGRNLGDVPGENKLSHPQVGGLSDPGEESEDIE